MPYDAFLEIQTYGDANLQGFKDFIKPPLAHERWIPGEALLINHTGPQTPPRSPIPQLMQRPISQCPCNHR